MDEEIKIKVKRKPPKKVVKQKVKAVEKKVKPKKKKKNPISEVVLPDRKSKAGEKIPEEIKPDLDLDLLDSEELDDESKRALIRARTAQAEKQNRLNLIAEGQLVERKEVIETIKKMTFGAVEILDLFPDQVGPLVHKKTPKQIREKLVQNVDKVKMKFINLLMEFDDE